MRTGLTQLVGRSRRDVLKLGMAAAGVAGLTGPRGRAARCRRSRTRAAPQLRGGSLQPRRHRRRAQGHPGAVLPGDQPGHRPLPAALRAAAALERPVRDRAVGRRVGHPERATTPSGRSGCATAWSSTTARPSRPTTSCSASAKVTDPKKPGSGGTELAKILELKNSKIVDPKTILLQLNSPYAVLDQLLAEYTRRHPPDRLRRRATRSAPARSRYKRFVPGQLSQFDRFDNYWDGPPFVDELIIYDFPDDAAKVNALLAGQVQSVDNLPSYLVEHHRAAGRVAADLRDRRLGAVHDAGRRRAVLRRAGPPGAAADRATASR